MVADDEKTEDKSKTAENKKEASKGKNGGTVATTDPLDEVMELTKKQEFGKAITLLTELLKKQPEDSVLLHNLGVIYTEQERWEEAEDTFMKAFEAQKASGKYNYATLFGLATVLTEQGGMGKLLQGEALFRDCLMKAVAQEEEGVFETYRTFMSLAENLGLQKRWKDAVEAYEQALQLGSRMFGEDHERTLAQRAMLARAKKLARMQKYMRVALWAGTAAVPFICAYLWTYAGGPSVGEIFNFAYATTTTTGLPQFEAEVPHSAEL